MPVTRCEAVAKLSSDPTSYGRSSFRQPSLAYTADAADRALAQALAADARTHEENAAAIAHNASLRSAITAIMRAAGIADEYRERDTRSRARFPKSIARAAGYLGDLSRNVPIDDGFATAQRRHAELASRFAEFRTCADREKEAAARAKEEALAKREADMEMARA